jgi:DNA-binding CsgD family transcriptional regulator/tetratricopeptide (TPR) repeat protein
MNLRDTAPVGRRVSCPDFVGRVEELGLIDSTLDLVADGQPQTRFVGGDAGIGKSRLVDELAERARSRGGLVAKGVCTSGEGGGLPYGPVVGILRSLMRQLGDTAAAELDAVAAGLGLANPASERAAESPLADGLAKTRLFESILTYFTTLARRSMVVVVFEDLQWADSSSAELVDFLARNLSETRVLLAGTYRSDELDSQQPFRRVLGELGRQEQVTLLRLNGLDLDEMSRLLAGIMDHQPARALVESVHARSGGNPFFAEELTAAGPENSLSRELQDVILTRVEALSANGQQVLRLAVTAGDTVDHRLLVAAAGLEAEALERALTEAVGRQILVVDAGSTSYHFRHALLREALYGALLPGERSRLHRQVALALASHSELQPSGPGHAAMELAGHWWAAGEWPASLPASLNAVNAAMAVMAFPEALRHMEHALSAWELVPDALSRTGIDHLQLLERASDVAYLGGAGQRSVDLAQAAIDGYEAAGDASGTARSYILLSRHAWAVGDFQTAVHACRKAAALLPADQPSVDLARMICEEAKGLMLVSRYHDAEARSRAAIDVARVMGARAEEGNALNTLGVCRASLGFPDEGIAMVRQSLVIAEELASPDDLNRAYNNLSALLSQWGRLEEAVTLVMGAIESEKFGGTTPNAALNVSDSLFRLGRWDEAKNMLDRAVDVVGVCGNSAVLARAPIALRQGHFDEAARLLDEADRMTAALSDVQVRGLLHLERAELALAEGRPHDASEEIEKGLALAAGTDEEELAPELCAWGIRALADQVDDTRVHRQRLDVDKIRLDASALVDEADRLIRAPVDRGGVSTPRTAALTVLCRAEQSRLYKSDPDLWEVAATRWADVSEVYFTAYCRWREAEALLASGAGRKRASESLQQAWRQCVDMGALPLRTEIERLAQRARIPLVTDDTATADAESARTDTALASDLGLTPREIEVLRHLAAGETDRQIAETLFISKKTASVHVSNLLRKLDVPTRVQAGAIGQAHGLGLGLG